VTSRLLASFLTLTVLVLVVLEVPLGITFADHERDRVTTEIERDAVVLSSFVEDALQDGGPIDRAAIDGYEKSTAARVVVVDTKGIAIVDTEGPAGRSFATRPEIVAALDGRVATGTRHSATLGHDLLYVAVPVASAGRVFGAVRVTYASNEMDRRVSRYWWTLAGVAAVSIVAVTLLGLVLARSVSKPLRRLERTTLALGRGDLAARVGQVDGPPLVRSLAGVFDDMAARLEDLVTAQDAFIADASHQLRNPLTALRLRLENVRRDVGASGIDDLDGALDEVVRLSRMVDGLLVLARSSRDAAPRPVYAIDIGPVVRAEQATWSALADERGVDLRADVGTGALALATEERVRQVIDNLVANALDAAPAGTSIDLRVDVGSTHVVVHVVDQGTGLSAEERVHAFDRFWQASTTTSRQLGGSGLGLAIVRRLVEADGGDVRLDAAASGGVDAVVRYRRELGRT
jgi:signal transduction histidine kinase